jgi:hypothetical protein
VSDIEQQDAWLQSAYSAVLAENASSIAVPHVFGRMVIRKRSRRAKVERPTLAGTSAAPSAVLCAADEVPAMLSSVASTVDARSEMQRYETLLGSLQANARYTGGAAAATEAQTDVPAAAEQRHVGMTGRSGSACSPGHALWMALAHNTTPAAGRRRAAGLHCGMQRQRCIVSHQGMPSLSLCCF